MSAEDLKRVQDILTKDERKEPVYPVLESYTMNEMGWETYQIEFPCLRFSFSSDATTARSKEHP